MTAAVTRTQFHLEKCIHFFGPVNGKTKMDSFMGMPPFWDKPEGAP
jgi:hypothetical protein